MTAESEVRTRTGWWSDDFSSPFAGRANWRWLLIGGLILLPFTIPITINAFDADVSASARWTTLLVLGAYAACYLVFPWAIAGGWMPRRVAFGALILGIGWILFAVVETGGVYGLLYAMIPIAMGLPLGWMFIFDGGTVVALVALEFSGAGYAFGYADVWSMVGISVALFFMVRLIRVVRRLREANTTIAHLAVSAERERLARDLHDILGHSLTTITVKAGAARRLLETGQEPSRAVEELRDVEALSRSALADVRATVSDYREVTLAAELVGARAALRAADIDADMPAAVDDVDPARRELFGYAVREAVTNTIRHSGAKRLRVRMGSNWIEIEDDGTPKASASRGNGLKGLAERVAPSGGTLEAGPVPDGGFKVRVEVP
ncbi:sensor histidine kinase, partial [Glycomyces arizonensis]|uniref:sensor histidine kinase n=1 Tax=Glycomyces arizonensis TaxID=256035 RepID=UPI0003F73813